MNILEVLALLGFGLACVKFGYELGKNAKKWFYNKCWGIDLN